MSNSIKHFNLFTIAKRKIATHLNMLQKSHYDILGISAKATQADIKSAYYKLSMQYHPDKNKNSEEAATKFRDITQAYEVLGNVKSRKLYDKGLLIQHSGAGIYDDSPINKFYKSRETKSRPPTPYGRTTVYDFDEWSKSHYGATFQRDLKFREQLRHRKVQQQQAAHDVKSEKVILLIGLFGVLSAYLLCDRNYDTPEQVTTFAGAVLVKSKSE